jgi:hypothetical protein
MSLLISIGYILLALFALAALSFAPWVPTKSHDVKRAIELSRLHSGEVFYDLWCWDGRVTFEAEKTGAKTIGIELFFPLYFLCLVKKFFLRSKVIFKCKSLFREDLSKADVIFLFGTPGPIKHTLREKLERELRTGTRIISYVFPFEDWTPEKVCKWSNGDELSIFCYRIP